MRKSITEAAKRSDIATCKVRAGGLAPLPASAAAPAVRASMCSCGDAEQTALPSTHIHTQLNATQILAKEIIQSRRAVSRLYVNKAQMISIGNALSEQMGASRSSQASCTADCASVTSSQLPAAARSDCWVRARQLQ